MSRLAPAGNIAGLTVHPLEMHADGRGHLTETFRPDWGLGFVPAQWHVLRSREGAISGMHLHLVHVDYKVVLDGRMVLGLKDLRAGSPTEDRTALLELGGDELVAVLIPHGVAHGLYALTDSLCLVAGTELYDPADDLEFSYADPELGFDWPDEPRHVSERDRTAKSLQKLRAKLA